MQRSLRATLAALLLMVGTSLRAGEPTISTFAGGGTSLGDGGPATSANLDAPNALAVDVAGNVYVSQAWHYGNSLPCRVRKIDQAGVIQTVVGNGIVGSSSTASAPATSIPICASGLAVDRTGNLYVADGRLRRVTADGIATVIAGNAGLGFSGDGGPAATARFTRITDVAADAAGNLFVIDGNRVRRIGTDGIVTTVAGSGSSGNSGDGGPAVAANISPRAIDVAPDGSLLIVDGSANTVRKVTPDGLIQRVAGAGPFRSDPLAIQSSLYYPNGVAVAADGSIYVSNEQNLAHVISPRGILAVVAGRYNDSTWQPYGAPRGFSGDGGPAKEALLNAPQAIAVGPDGSIYIADANNSRVRKVTPIVPPRVPAGTGRFHPVQNSSFGNSPANAVALGDINGDGRTDVVVTTTRMVFDIPEPDDYQVHVFRQGADGTLQPRTSLPLAPGSGYAGMLVGDINRDGYGDVVMTANVGVMIYPGSASGTLGTPVTWPAFPNAEASDSLALADVDGDGHLDVIATVAGQAGGGSSASDEEGLAVFYGGGGWSLARKRFYPSKGSGLGRMRLADVNFDGKLDVVTTWAVYGTSDSGLAIYIHDGADGFLPPTIVTIGQPYFVAGLAVGDIDADGLLDFLVSFEANAPDAAIARFRQTAAGLVIFDRVWPTYDAPTSLEITDVNGDGLDDLLTKHQGWSSIGLRQQAWEGLSAAYGLDLEVKYWIVSKNHATAYDLGVADLNADGCPDVATADSWAGLEILYSTGCFRAPRVPRKHLALPLPLATPRLPHDAPGGPVSTPPTRRSALLQPWVAFMAMTFLLLCSWPWRNSLLRFVLRAI